ncbi:MAG: selenoneine biosynthesis selenosugar synthase SenB [Verrucomicrobiota bacterium]
MLTPSAAVTRTGNRCTATQWAEMIAGEGIVISKCEGSCTGGPKILIGLHAERSHPSIVDFREKHPDGRVVLALTGTDIYPEPSKTSLESIELADRLVLLQHLALNQLPEASRGKARVIVQSAIRLSEQPVNPEFFDVCVVGHLRYVKDPLRTAQAARLLPATSRIRVLHAGGILDPRYEELVEIEQAENPRYRYLGELGEQETADLIAQSQLLIVTSQQEGGARVVGEAVVHLTPVISSRIDGVVGLLGAEYPGYFEVGDAEGLARLLSRAETNLDFASQLRDLTSTLASQFAPETEQRAWQNLISGLSPAS